MILTFLNSETMHDTMMVIVLHFIEDLERNLKQELKQTTVREFVFLQTRIIPPGYNRVETEGEQASIIWRLFTKS